MRTADESFFPEHTFGLPRKISLEEEQQISSFCEMMRIIRCTMGPENLNNKNSELLQTALSYSDGSMKAATSRKLDVEKVLEITTATLSNLESGENKNEARNDIDTESLDDDELEDEGDNDYEENYFDNGDDDDYEDNAERTNEIYF